MKDCTVPY